MLEKRKNCNENWEREKNIYFQPKKIMMYHTLFYNCPIWQTIIGCLFSQLSYITYCDWLSIIITLIIIFSSPFTIYHIKKLKQNLCKRYGTGIIKGKKKTKNK